MAARGKTLVASFRPDHETDDWVDREIASLRQSIEGEAARQEAGHRPQAERWRRGIRVARPLPRGVSHAVTSAVRQLPKAVLLLRQAAGVVRRRRFDIIFCGLCIAVTIALVLVTVSILGR
jgi:hypothetical protein